MTNKNLDQLLEAEAALLCPVKEKGAVINYELLLKDIVSLSLYLQHEDSQAVKHAGEKMMRNLIRVFESRPAFALALANIKEKAGEDYEVDKAIALSISAHTEFNSLWGDHSDVPKTFK